ncbi:ribA [Symbiodinium microadriaticum]|nr:ribA [Symbiodinium microadriaticum]
MQKIADEGRGIILYLRQEGRGIGLLNKIKAYALQDSGADTVEANVQLGFKPDGREYEICKPMLEHFHIASVRLMTNNPGKVDALNNMGIEVSSIVSIHAAANPHNESYLAVKVRKLGHIELGETAGLDVAVIEDWQEIDYGDWDGMPATEWRKIAAEQFRAFRKDLSALAPPNGESFLQFRDRVLSAWNQLSQYEDGAHLLLVTHGGVMRVILPTVLGMPLNRSFPLHIPFACFSRVVVEVRDDKTHASLVFHNAAEHDSYPA